MNLKITSWNIEHSNRLISGTPNKLDKERIDRIHQTFDEISPDIICLAEGPKGETAVKAFCENILQNKWQPVLLNSSKGGARDRKYQINGTQWIWFLAREPWLDRVTLQAPDVWQSFTGQKTWAVNYWGNVKAERHRHYLHPQVLRVNIGSETIELIGLHLKSKINRNPLKIDDRGNVLEPYLSTALTARIKLATEARNVLRYIDARFDQSVALGIIVMGDVNDGPGQDWFEERYMFFDLISNLQGSVLRANRFLNHALFDYPEHLRWTAKYRDPIKRISAPQNPLLIDHILLSQPMVNGAIGIQAKAGSGFVEHEAYERGNAKAKSKEKTSDHRPISLVLQAA